MGIHTAFVPLAVLKVGYWLGQLALTGHKSPAVRLNGRDYEDSNDSTSCNDASIALDAATGQVHKVLFDKIGGKLV